MAECHEDLTSQALCLSLASSPCQALSAEIMSTMVARVCVAKLLSPVLQSPGHCCPESAHLTKLSQYRGGQCQAVEWGLLTWAVSQQAHPVGDFLSPGQPLEPGALLEVPQGPFPLCPQQDPVAASLTDHQPLTANVEMSL